MVYELYISAPAIGKAVNQCLKSLDSSPPLEKGGFLIGIRDDVRRSIIITDSCSAPYAVSAPSYMQITHDDWEYADKYLKKKSSGISEHNIYGWYHSHPGYGVFASSKDLFIIKSFFAKPWNVSLVIDPLNTRFGFFGWEPVGIRPIQEFMFLPKILRGDKSQIIKAQIEDKGWKYLDGNSTLYDATIALDQPLSAQLSSLNFHNEVRRIYVNHKNRDAIRITDMKLSPLEIGMTDGDIIVLE